mgnify:CR=1 FL=1
MAKGKVATMQIGLQLYGCADYWLADAPGFFEKVKAMGYTSVEPCIWFGQGTPLRFTWAYDDLEKYLDSLRALGMTAPSCHVFSESLVNAIPYMQKVAENTEFRYFVIGDDRTWNAPAIDAFAEDCVTVSNALAEKNAELLFHNGWEGFRTRIDGLYGWEYLLRRAGGKLGAQLDSGWATYGGANLSALLKDNEQYIRSIHHKDIEDIVTPPSELYNLQLGTGIVDNVAPWKFGVEHGLYQLVDLDNSRNDFMEALTQSLAYLTQL